MKKFLIELFTWKGRWNRFKFWIYPLSVFILIILIGAISVYNTQINNAKNYSLIKEQNNLQLNIEKQKNNGLSNIEIMNSKEVIQLKDKISSLENDVSKDSSNMRFIIGIMILILYILLIWVSIMSYIKRLHDLDKSGWMVLLLFVPFVSIYLFIICGFLKGTSGKNRFGDNPLGNSEKKIENNDSNIKL